MRFAFTGPVNPPREEFARARELALDDIARLQAFDADRGTGLELRTGCALGVDSGIITAAALRFPGSMIHLVRPRAPSNAAVLEAALNASIVWHGRLRLHRAAPGRSDPDAYMNRNELLVEDTDVLYAFPETAAEVRRSGTWSTVRRARARGVEIRFYPLDGSAPWREWTVGGDRRRWPEL